MTAKIAAALIAGVLIPTVQVAEAGSFDGWCFMGDECAGPSKITEDAFVTCEENCRLTKPTRLNGMNGLLYNVVCEGETGSSTERMLLLRYKDPGGRLRVLAIGKHGSQELKRCKD